MDQSIPYYPYAVRMGWSRGKVSGQTTRRKRFDSAKRLDKGSDLAVGEGVISGIEYISSAG